MVSLLLLAEPYSIGTLLPCSSDCDVESQYWNFAALSALQLRLWCDIEFIFDSLKDAEKYKGKLPVIGLVRHCWTITQRLLRESQCMATHKQASKQPGVWALETAHHLALFGIQLHLVQWGRSKSNEMEVLGSWNLELVWTPKITWVWVLISQSLSLPQNKN